MIVHVYCNINVKFLLKLRYLSLKLSKPDDVNAFFNGFFTHKEFKHLAFCGVARRGERVVIGFIHLRYKT